eukprot:scaffold63805_cov20-Prasinocladus_malaysianus.AAC.1
MNGVETSRSVQCFETPMQRAILDVSEKSPATGVAGASELDSEAQELLQQSIDTLRLEGLIILKRTTSPGEHGDLPPIVAAYQLKRAALYGDQRPPATFPDNAKPSSDHDGGGSVRSDDSLDSKGAGGGHEDSPRGSVDEAEVQRVIGQVMDQARLEGPEPGGQAFVSFTPASMHVLTSLEADLAMAYTAFPVCLHP